MFLFSRSLIVLILSISILTSFIFVTLSSINVFCDLRIILIIRTKITSIGFIIIFCNIYISYQLCYASFRSSLILWRACRLFHLLAYHTEYILWLVHSFSVDIACSANVLAILWSMLIRICWICIIWSSYIISLVSLLVLSILLLTLIDVWSWLVLMALCELITNSIVLHVCVYEMLESIIVSMYFHWVWNYIFYTIIVTGDFYLFNNAIRACRVTWRYFWKNLVIMASYEQIWNCIAWSNFNFAIMSSKNHIVTWFCKSHADTMVWDVYWIINLLWYIHMGNSSSKIWMLFSWIMSSTRISTLRILRILDVCVSHHSRLMTKCISKLLLEIYIKSNF